MSSGDACVKGGAWTSGRGRRGLGALDNRRPAAHPVAAERRLSLQISVTRTHEGIARLTDAVDALLARHAVSEATLFDARLIVEEISCNVVEHGQACGDAPMELHVAIDEATLLLEFRDAGAAFDPTALPGPALDADIAQRRPGGLGVHLVRSLAQSVAYQRVDDCNVLRILLRLDAAPDNGRP